MSNLTVPIESPWVLRISAPGSNRFRDIKSQNFDADLLTLEANPGAKIHQNGR